MPLQLVPEFLCNPFLKRFDFFVYKFDHCAGMQIDQVVVVISLGVFVACAAIPKIELL